MRAPALTAETITDDQIREGHDDDIISYDLMEFATFPAWKATHADYRARCAEIINATNGIR